MREKQGTSIGETLEALRNGRITVAEAEKRLARLPFQDLGFANVDTHRALRKGFPEVVFAARKKPGQVAKIVQTLAAGENLVLVTHALPGAFRAVKRVARPATYHADSRMIVVGKLPKAHPERRVAVITAGTSDIPVAEEAALTARALGADVDTLFDVGVAGIHRLFAHYERIREAKVCIVVAGMEGALPSIVAGIFGGPVIAVPTSVGYGASFEGLAALLTMMNSCSAGVGVVNIDNGFGAGYLAGLITRLIP